ncbi:MAG TPA: ACP S-malonyltransferase [Candidatus Babeliales bacterium]|nr:ACP S-malonyltransferase [Candidatus Babeliales bacterium]
MNKIAVLFSGYGSQYVGMGKDIYDESRTMQEFFEEAANCLDINFVKLCFASSDSELRQIRNAYLALFTVNSALYTILQEEISFTPEFVSGMGVGEYSALFAARSITFPDGLYLLNIYAQAFEELLLTHRLGILQLLSISVSDLKKIIAQIPNLSQHQLTVSHIIDNDSFFISGHQEGIIQLREFLSDKNNFKNVAIEEIDEGYGINSPIMENVLEYVKGHLHQVDFKDLILPLINTVDGACIKKGESAKYSIMRQINEPTLWNQVMENFVGIDTILVIGPDHDLAETVSRVYPDKKIMVISKRSEIEEFKKAYMQGVAEDVDKQE